jgi:rhamnose utilization protein RhaD (predicted bifunctional aldolase and dehydrogenase)
LNSHTDTKIPPILLPELLATSKYAAGSLLLCQAAGGNNSVKDVGRDLLWVKASGVRLSSVSATSGTVALRTSHVRNVVRSRSLEEESRSAVHERAIRQTCAAALDSSQGRPSLETGFHALLGNVVLHLHPVYVNTFTCMEHGDQIIHELAPRDFKWIPYGTPGQELALKVDHAISAERVASETTCLLLENHGFISSGKNAADVIGATEDFVQVGQKTFGSLPPALLAFNPPSAGLKSAAVELESLARERWGDRSFAVRPTCFAAFEEMATNHALWESPGPLVPDDVIFAGKGIRFVKRSSLVDALDHTSNCKLAVAVDSVGTILLARNEALLSAMEETLLAHVLVRILVAQRGGVLRTLPAEEIDYLENMESEKYRIMVSAKGAV